MVQSDERKTRRRTRRSKFDDTSGDQVFAYCNERGTGTRALKRNGRGGWVVDYSQTSPDFARLQTMTRRVRCSKPSAFGAFNVPKRSDDESVGVRDEYMTALSCRDWQLGLRCGIGDDDDELPKWGLMSNERAAEISRSAVGYSLTIVTATEGRIISAGTFRRVTVAQQGELKV